MTQGDIYSTACEKAGYDHTMTKEKLTTPMVKGGKRYLNVPDKEIIKNKITSPVVRRTIAQFRKLYNAMVREYGEPNQIVIESGKDLKSSFEKRREIKEKQDANAAKNQAVVNKLQELKIAIEGKNITKYKLYELQDCKCIYSGKKLEIDQLFEHGYCDIDHILPRSRSQDDSFSNKVLCFTSENQQKGNKTPFEYFGEDKERWHNFSCRVASLQSLGAKRIENLLNLSFNEDELKFITRNTNDNSHIATFITKYCKDGLNIPNAPKSSLINIKTVSGKVTASLRKHWGLEKIRDENDKHHAQDAIVVACATQGMVGYIASINQRFEKKYELIGKYGRTWFENFKEKFKVPTPWTTFREDTVNGVKEVFVSRSPRKKATGAFHAETITPKSKFVTKSGEIKAGVPIRKGMAANGDMLRIDLFEKKNKNGKIQFFAVPVYIFDAYKKQLPNVIKPQNIAVDDTFKFKFSIFKDDYIEIKDNDGTIAGYYASFDVDSGRVTLNTHDKHLLIDGNRFFRKGIKTVESIKKYQVDYLGLTKFEIKSETRLDFNNKK